MAVTIAQIAEKAGVSRGTVDRALNNRGRISPEVAERICTIAAEMGYETRERKKKREKARRIGVITQYAGVGFMEEIEWGIERAREELGLQNIEVLNMSIRSLDEQRQLDAIDAMVKEGIDALAIMPVDTEAIREKLNMLIEEKQIPVVTFNSDIVGCKRACFVGMDNRQSGRAAAGLMAMLTGGKGKILVITGVFSSNVSNNRLDGFIEELRSYGGDLTVAAVQGSFDDAEEVKRIILETMSSVPDINGIFLISGGQKGLADAFLELGPEKRPYTIIYDLTKRNREIIRNGLADFLIDQGGYVQGYEPLMVLADILRGKKEKEPEDHYTEIKILTKYNL